MTSESLPTPDGSIMTRSGVYFVRTSFKERPKSPTKEQQMHPEFISRISIPESFKIRRRFRSHQIHSRSELLSHPSIASFRSFFINVVFPAPRKPEIISIFVIMTPLSCHLCHVSVVLTGLFSGVSSHPQTGTHAAVFRSLRIRLLIALSFFVTIY